MLVLTRMVGEVIVIDDSILITLTNIDRNRTRIGITAPKYLKIKRLELHENPAELNRKIMELCKTSEDKKYVYVLVDADGKLAGVFDRIEDIDCSNRNDMQIIKVEVNKII